MSVRSNSADVATSRPAEPDLPLDLSFMHAQSYPRTAQQLAYTVLRESIMNGSLPPGTRLAQVDVASKLSLSTTPVREALRRLASDGFVRIDTHRGAIVRGLDRKELEGIYELRLLLEPLGIRKAVRNISAQELTAAESICASMEATSDAEQWSEWNREFHAIFARASAAPTLERILQGLRDSAALYVLWSMVASTERTETANREHRELLEAVRKRDEDRAAAIETQHLLRTLESIVNAD